MSINRAAGVAALQLPVKCVAMRKKWLCVSLIEVPAYGKLLLDYQPMQRLFKKHCQVSRYMDTSIKQKLIC